MSDSECLNSRISKVEDKLELHDSKLDRHDRRITDLKDALHENTRITQKVADNTGELVDLFRGAKAFRKFFLWASPVIVGVIGVYQWIIGLK